MGAGGTAVPQWTISSLLGVTAGFLERKGSSSPRLDAELLLAHTLGLERIQLYAQHDRPVTGSELDAYRGLVARRAAHEPVAYLVGRASFRYLELEVDPHVLIPRPETEELVEAVLDWLKERPLLEPSRTTVVDVGTGSGAIALSLAREAGAAVLGIDSSAEALAVASRNRDALGLDERVSLASADLLRGREDGRFRVVVSNPPYVSHAELAGLAPDVREFEPLAALDGGGDGLAVYRRLVPQAGRALGPGGALFLELGEGQAEAVERLAREAGFCLTRRLRDLSGKERILLACLPGCLRVDVDGLTPATAATLTEALHRGALLGVPTDTVYGLAAAWRSGPGIRRLFEAKGRGEESPVAVLFASVAAVRESLPDLDPRAERVLEALLPGPYTFVVATAVPRPPLVGTPDSLGVRVPAHPPLLRIMEALGVPLAATSANFSGKPDPASLDEVESCLLAHCAFGLAAPTGSAGSALGLASTVVDLRPLAGGEPARVLRDGAVPAGEALGRIAAALGD